MSRAMAETFFPALASMQQRLAPKMYDQLFPDAVAERCPVAHVTLGNLIVRWPGLVIPAILGACVGLFGASRFMAKGTTHDRLWGWAFFWFGLMNVDAIFYHCLAPIGSTLHDAMWLCDCLFTGNSGMALAMAAIHEYAQLPRSQTLVATSGLRRRFQDVTRVDRELKQAWLLFLIAGAFWKYAFGWTAIGEAIYLVPCGVAAVALGFLHIVEPTLMHGRPPSLSLTFAALAMLSVGAMLNFDGYLCDTIGATVGNMPVVGFLACDVAFVGIWIWLSGCLGKVAPSKLHA